VAARSHDTFELSLEFDHALLGGAQLLDEAFCCCAQRQVRCGAERRSVADSRATFGLLFIAALAQRLFAQRELPLKPRNLGPVLALELGLELAQLAVIVFGRRS
jgi:hypothetical protein